MELIRINMGYDEGFYSIVVIVEVRLFGILLKRKKEQYWKHKKS